MMIDDIEGCAPFPGATDTHGQVEQVGGIDVHHWFIEAAGSRYHGVVAGDRNAPPVLLLHGLPECWYAWHHQITDLARDHFVIAPDLKGYGQSDKRLDLSYTFAHGAFEMALILERFGVDQFDMIGHDRGAVLGDHMFAVPGVADRVGRYARLQQSFNKAHGEPRPPHALMSSPEGVELFLSDIFPRVIFEPVEIPGLYQVTFNQIAEETIDRIDREFHRPGVAHAVRLTFIHTNFDIEMADRERHLIPKMKCPVHLIQAELDPGQKPADYEDLEELGPNFTIEWIDGAGHFSHLEMPDQVSAAIRTFLDAGR
jgi:pimeloyl-ACP methyl ester carboxylesterase